MLTSRPNPLALVADIGGTNARFALADISAAEPLLLDTVRQLPVSEFASLVDAARHYLRELGPAPETVRDGVFGVAGRVDGDLARITNHPWVISRSESARALGLDTLHLINDFIAQAMAVALLHDGDLVAIGPSARGQAEGATRTYAVVGPGTGLGVSALVVRQGVSFALETEGGHAGFAPATAEEAAILSLLAADFGRVSIERLLSGQGLSNIHRSLLRIAGAADATALPPEQITAAALAGDAACQRAIAVFCQVFGSFAGDLVLTLGAWDGVFLTGGLVPKLLPALRNEDFRRGFERKGRFSDAVARVPTLAVVHPHAGLLGAAAYAVQYASVR